jgi:hypothetical protein
VNSRCLSQFALACGVLSSALLAAARAGEPTLHVLADLAPVLDSSNAGCQSLDIGGRNVVDATVSPTLRFRALYRAPRDFSLLISGATDDIPLAFCSGRKALAYDPVGSIVYYSENARFTLEVAAARERGNFGYHYYLILPRNKEPNGILVDLRSWFSTSARAAESGLVQDKVVKRNASEFVLTRKFNNGYGLTFNVDLTQQCVYTAATVSCGDKAFLALDRLILNHRLEDEDFWFPTKRQLSRVVRLKDVTSDIVHGDDLNRALDRAMVIRAILNRPAATEPDHVSALPGVDWDRVRESDAKYAKALRDIVPPKLRAP